MPEVVQTPKGIRPFKFWGIDLEENGSDDAYGDCIFCGREAKFGVNIESGIWHCLKCGAKGNPLTFIRQLYTQLTEEGLDDLAEQRGLISAEGLLAWGVRWDGRTGCHVIPGYDASGKLVQLYRYIYGSLDKRWKLLPTPTLGHGIHRPSDWKEGKPTVFAGEGPWDGIALWEVLRAAKTGTGGLTLTGNVGGSLYADANVCAIPGCGSVGEPLKRWMPMFAGSRLCLLFDSDYPRENEGRTIPPAGYAAAERAVGLLALAPQPPNEVQILRWGPDGYDPELPSGSDVRDVLKQGPTLVSRLPLLSNLLEKIEPIPESWLRGRTKAAARQGGLELECLPCRSWSELINQWRKAMKWTEGLDRALSVMLASNASTRSVGDQLWVKILGPASCGKSTLCEALSVARKYVFPTDTMTSLVSGYQVDNEGSENLSLVKRLHNKSLVINDGDTLLRLPNKEQILSQMRAFYGRNLRAQYANKMSGDHEGINSTIILCGTGSLRELDSSELGERFLDCVVMNGIDPDLERQILWRVVNRAEHTIGLESDGSPESQDEPEMLKAKQLTGGYITYLNENFQELVLGVHADESSLEQCLDLGLFIAHMRARPSKIQKESDEREFAARLVSQLHRLAKFLAVVLNRKSLDSEVMRRVAACAMDTAAGSTMRIAKYLRDSERKGHPQDAIAMHVNMPIEETKKLLRFMSKIKVTEAFRESEKGKVRWRLTPSMTKLWDTVMSGNVTIRF